MADIEIVIGALFESRFLFDWSHTCLKEGGREGGRGVRSEGGERRERGGERRKKS